MSQIDEDVCRSYFTNPEVLEEFNRVISAKENDVKSRFYLCFCLWLRKQNWPPADDFPDEFGFEKEPERNPPENRKIAALFKMFLNINIDEKCMNIYEDCMPKEIKEVYETWAKLAREDEPSFSFGLQSQDRYTRLGRRHRNSSPFIVPPLNTRLRCLEGSVVLIFENNIRFVIDHNGEQVKHPHGKAYKALNDSSEMINWAYSVEPVRPQNYVGKFLTREIAKGRTMEEALLHACVDNWGIVSAILENNQFSKNDRDIWDKIMTQNINDNNKRLKNIKCAIQQLRSGYRFSWHVWDRFFGFLMKENDVKKVYKLIKSAINHREGNNIKIEVVAFGVVERYSNSHPINPQKEKLLLETIIDFYAITQSSNESERDVKKDLMVKAIKDELKKRVFLCERNQRWLNDII